MYGPTSYFDLQGYYYDVTITIIRFANAHLTASIKVELATQNAAFEIIA